MSSCVVRFVVMAVLTGILAGTAAGQEWTRFRGPNGSGLSDARTIPVKWTDADVQWKAKLPGEGISSPVLWGDRVFVTSAEPDQGQRHLLCLHTKDGRELWRQSESFEKYKKHAVNTFATSTPAVDAERVYQVWQSPTSSVLRAFTHDGQPVWIFALDPFSEGHGGGVSPIVIDGKLYGVSDDGEVVVLVADDTLEILARNPLDEPSRATPAVSGGRLYVRTMSQLLCVGSAP